MASPSPIDDLTYDLVTVLQNKAEALEAYDKHLRDADDDEIVKLFSELRREDERHVRLLKQALVRRLDQDAHLDEEDEIDGDDAPAPDDDYDDYDDEDVVERSNDLVIEQLHSIATELEPSTSRAAPLQRRGETQRRT
ncbi:MAG: hypothetical protein KF819_19025 [Labilithrix sp.]|nr:hypothetical protein [Labilithrix sp.]